MEPQEFVVTVPVLNLYDSRECARLATQAWAGRHVVISGDKDKNQEAGASCATRGPFQAILLEDSYSGWLAPDALSSSLKPVVKDERYGPSPLTRDEINPRLGQVIEFALAAGERTNRYLWGGTTGPDFDCSGLVQRAFASEGIWVPRDAYQQEEFTTSIPRDEIQPGDLVFFGRGVKATHVGLCVAIDRGPISEAAIDTLGVSVEYDERCQSFGHTKSLSAGIQSPIVASSGRLDVGGDGLESGQCSQQVRYVHSSGKEHGRDGIHVDVLAAEGGPVALHYFEEFRGVGRVDGSL